MRSKAVWPSAKPTLVEQAEAGVKLGSLGSQPKMSLLRIITWKQLVFADKSV